MTRHRERYPMFSSVRATTQLLMAMDGYSRGTEHVRRAHIDVVDARESKGLWMMHVCVFPVIQNDGPIYGFDAPPNALTSQSKINGK